MRGAVPFCLLGLVAAALPLGAATGGPVLLQPANGRDETIVEVDGRTATVRSASGGRQRFRLRPAERLLGLEELESGWVAAGIRLLGEGTELLLVEQGPEGLRRLGVPTAGAGPLLRTRPAVLASAGRIEGLAWLEGAPGEPLTVHAARRGETGGWEETVTVSRPGRGSQTGLVGTVLADGRWLLCWSRFDGSDDELVWSVGDAAGWSAPRPVHAGNDVPDVAPALFAAGDVVLLAWSRLVDAEYRVLTARWNGGRWEAPRQAAGAGSLYPTFAGLDGDPYLVVRRARAGAWEVIDVDASGAPLRRLQVVDPGRDRPALLGGSGTRAELLLPGVEAPRQGSWEVVER